MSRYIFSKNSRWYISEIFDPSDSKLQQKASYYTLTDDVTGPYYIVGTSDSASIGVSYVPIVEPVGADVTLGVVDSQGRFQSLRFNGTQASNSGSAIEVYNYKTWNSTLPAPQPSGGSMEFYKCAAVNTANQTWSGYKAVLSGGVYSFESTVTSGLTYSVITPVIGNVYTDGALVRAKLYDGKIPADDLLVSALPDPTWVSSNSVPAWGDFSQADPSKRPTLATIGDVVGIKARKGDVLYATAPEAISGDFTYLAKICIGTPVDIGEEEDMTLLSNNQTGSAIIAFGDAYSSDCLLLSVQGVSAAWSNISMSGLSAGTHTLAVTYNATSGAVKFYVDGSLAYTDSESYSGGTYFDQSATFYYSQSTTSDNLILGLAAYNRILTDAEIAAVNW